MKPIADHTTIGAEGLRLLVAMHRAGGWVPIDDRGIDTFRALARRGLAIVDGVIPIWTLTAHGKREGLRWHKAFEVVERAKLAREEADEHLDASVRMPIAAGAMNSRTPWPRTARRCPRCGCSAAKPCSIILPNDAGEAACVPAGVHDQTECSACALEWVHWGTGGPHNPVQPLCGAPIERAFPNRGDPAPRMCKACEGAKASADGALALPPGGGVTL